MSTKSVFAEASVSNLGLKDIKTDSMGCFKPQKALEESETKTAETI